MDVEGDLTWGDEHTIRLWICAPETCIIVLTSITTINSIKRKKIEKNDPQRGGKIHQSY